MVLWEVSDPCIPLARRINIAVTSREKKRIGSKVMDCRSDAFICASLIELKLNRWMSCLFTRYSWFMWHCYLACNSRLSSLVSLSPYKTVYTELQFAFVLGQERVVNIYIIDVDWKLCAPNATYYFWSSEFWNDYSVFSFARVNTSTPLSRQDFIAMLLKFNIVIMGLWLVIFDMIAVHIK